MSRKGFVVPVGGETAESVMLFEETAPSGTETTFQLDRDSDEVAWVLSGEITFKIGDEVTVGGPGTCAFMPRGVPHAWKNTSAETGRVLFLYTPAKAGGFFEERLGRPEGSINGAEATDGRLLARRRSELVRPADQTAEQPGCDLSRP